MKAYEEAHEKLVRFLYIQKRTTIHDRDKLKIKELAEEMAVAKVSDFKASEQ